MGENGPARLLSKLAALRWSATLTSTAAWPTIGDTNEMTEKAPASKASVANLTADLHGVGLGECKRPGR